MDNKELQAICGRVKNVSKRLSMSVQALGYNFVYFNDPKHIFENIRKYEDYSTKDITNVFDGIVKNKDGKFEPSCGYSVDELYNINETPNWANEIKGKLSDGMLIVPYEDGDIIEYCKNDKDGDRHRYISHVIYINGKYQIYGDDDINFDDISIVVRDSEDIEEEIRQKVCTEKFTQSENSKENNPYSPLINRLNFMFDVAYELSDEFEEMNE